MALVVTGADRRRGRAAAPSPSPVKAAAIDLGLVVSERVEDVTVLEPPPSLGVVVAFGRLVKPDVLAVVPMWNVHFSLLPRWRGAAPVERAILAGDERTGVCIMGLEEGLDTGPVLARAEVEIGADETAAELRSRLGVLGTQLLLEVLAAPVPGRPQEGEPTYAAKLSRDELALDFEGGAEMIVRTVRVGRAFTTWRGRRLLVHAATVEACPVRSPGVLPGALVGDLVVCGEGAVRLLVVQPEGRAPQPFAAWAAGARPGAGERFGA